MKLATPFSDNMMLQCGRPNPIWGWDKPQMAVRIRMGAFEAKAQADSKGYWRCELPPREPGSLHEIEVQGSERVVLHNVLAGEVWLCSGQSNMEWPLKDSDRFREDQISFHDPLVRLLHIPRAVADEPQSEAKCRWQALNPVRAANFSAVALYFARELRKETGRPVGLIGSYWGGTPIQCWTSRPKLEANPENRDYLDWISRQPRRTGSFKFEVKDLSWDGDAPEAVHETGFNLELNVDDKSKATLKKTGETFAVEGELFEGGWIGAGADLVPADRSRFKGLSFQTRGSGCGVVALDSSQVLDWAFHRSPEIELSESWQQHRFSFSQFSKPWGDAVTLDLKALTRLNVTSADTFNARKPAQLFNAMLAPLVPFGMRGAIWYQGETNARSAGLYARQQKDLIEDWRANFENPELAFFAVQLAAWMPAKKEPAESEWAELREAQQDLFNVKGAGLATAIDIGEAADIHPRNKHEVGRRLALQALAQCYDKKLVSRGPLFSGASFAGTTATARFELQGSKMASLDGKALRGFAVAGEDQRFAWADAKIEGDTVVASNPGVPKPCAIRYDWADNPDGNLGNAAALPAFPFRSDRWPGLTQGKTIF